MYRVEQQPDFYRAEHTAAHSAYDERGAGVVAEAEEPLSLACRYGALPFHVRNVCRAERVAARQADEQRRSSRSAYPVKPRCKRRKDLPQHPRQPEAVEEYRQHKEREQRRDYHPPAQLQCIEAGCRCLLCREYQRRHCAQRRRHCKLSVHRAIPPLSMYHAMFRGIDLYRSDRRCCP